MSSTKSGAARWRGKVAVVTGATSGIGAATARVLWQHGMKVAITGRRTERLQALVEELDDGGEQRALPITADFRAESDVRAVFARVRDLWGGTDVLVNNAGLGFASPLTEDGAEQWRTMLDVNVLALLIATQEAVADMRKRGDDGHVIHLGSMAGHRPTKAGVYAATKYAVRALTESLRAELRVLGSKIRVSCISPGFVRTEFANVYEGDDGAADRWYGSFPVLTSEDIAESVRWVLHSPAHMQVHDILLRPTDQPN